MSETLRVFHILDSLPEDSLAVKEAKQLQIILLKHYQGATFKEGRITTNIAQVISFILHHLLIYSLAQVPHQLNNKDCGCFTIYFAKKFLTHPDATIALLKVISSIFSLVLS